MDKEGMRTVLTLIEKMLNDAKGDNPQYEIRVNLASGGNFPRRKSFTRTTMRQTTLFEFAPVETDVGVIEPVPSKVHPRHIIYEVHPRAISLQGIGILLEELLDDLDNYIRSQR